MFLNVMMIIKILVVITANDSNWESCFKSFIHCIPSYIILHVNTCIDYLQCIYSFIYKNKLKEKPLDHKRAIM